MNIAIFQPLALAIDAALAETSQAPADKVELESISIEMSRRGIFLTLRFLCRFDLRTYTVTLPEHAVGRMSDAEIVDECLLEVARLRAAAQR